MTIYVIIEHKEPLLVGVTSYICLDQILDFWKLLILEELKNMSINIYNFCIDTKSGKNHPELLEAILGPKFRLFFFKIWTFSKNIFFFESTWKMQKKIFTPLWGQVTWDLEFFQNFLKLRFLAIFSELSHRIGSISNI